MPFETSILHTDDFGYGDCLHLDKGTHRLRRGSIEQVTRKDEEMKMGMPCPIAYIAQGELIFETKLA